jgi:hypothetical protein
MTMLLQHETLLLWLTGLSVLTLAGTVIAVPWLVCRLPADYFCHSHREPLTEAPDSDRPGLVTNLLKNMLGGLMVLAGLLMLITPGQGLLTLLAGLLVMNFPGKYRLERVLVARPGVMGALNWLRKRRLIAPFKAPYRNSTEQ